jgi:hypothetical protein
MAEKLGYCFVALLAALGGVVIIVPLVADAGVGRGTGIPAGSILLLLSWLAWRAVRRGRAKIVLLSAAGALTLTGVRFGIGEFGPAWLSTALSFLVLVLIGGGILSGFFRKKTPAEPRSDIPELSR